MFVQNHPLPVKNQGIGAGQIEGSQINCVGRIGNSNPNPRPHDTRWTHSCQLPLCAKPHRINFRSKTAFVWYSQRFDARNRRKLHNAYNPDLADYTTHRTKPAPDPHQSALRHLCHFYSAGLPPQCLVELQFRDRLCIDTRIVQQPIMPGFRSQVCRLVKLKFRDCLKHRFRSSQLLPNLHLQRR